MRSGIPVHHRSVPIGFLGSLRAGAARATRFVAVALALIMLFPTASAWWATRGSYEHDQAEALYFSSPMNPYTGGFEHYRAGIVYFNAYPVHGSDQSLNPNIAVLSTQIPGFIGSFQAMLGIWRDCNRDGYVGLAESVSYVYSAELVDRTVCPRGKWLHNDGAWAREFIPIGPQCSLEQRRIGTTDCTRSTYVVEAPARVWGDNGGWNAPEPRECPNVFIPEGSADDVGPSLAYGECVLAPVVGWPLLTRPNPLHSAPTNPCLDPGRAYRHVLETQDHCDYPNPLRSGQATPTVVARCGIAVPLAKSDGNVHPTLPGPDLGSLWVPTVVPAPGRSNVTLGDCSQTPSGYAMYAATPATPAPKKTTTDWEFLFYDGMNDNDVLGEVFGKDTPSSNYFHAAFDAVGDFPIWVGTRSDTIWTNPYLGAATLDPEATQNFTFYADIDSAYLVGLTPNSPWPAGSYLDASCSYYHYEWVNCNRGEWWYSGNYQPHQASLYDPFDIVDVDCYDAQPFTLGPRHPTANMCERPDPQLLALAGGVDYNEDCIGDQWQSIFAEFNGGEPLGPDGDGDADGASNLDEFQWRTVPVDTPDYDPLWLLGLTEVPWPSELPLPSSQDFDRDGWYDGAEIAYWDAAVDHCSYSSETVVALYDPDSLTDVNGDGAPNHNDDDADGDGLKDGLEVADGNAGGSGSYPELVDSDCPPSLQTADYCLLPSATKFSPTTRTGHGDSLLDAAEYAAWDTVRAERGLARTADAIWWNIDGDPVASNLLDPDSDGDGLLDGQEWATWSGTRTPSSSAMHRFDTDADHLLDGQSMVVMPSDPRYDLFEDDISHCNLPTYPEARKYRGELEFGTPPNQWNELPEDENCVTPASRYGDTEVYTDVDLPVDEAAAWVQGSLATQGASELMQNATAAVKRCIAYDTWMGLPEIQQEAHDCVTGVDAYVRAATATILGPTPLAPLTNEALLFADDVVANVPDLTQCLPDADGLPGTLPEGAIEHGSALVECAEGRIVPFVSWLLDRSQRFVGSAVDATIDATPAGPFVREATQTLQGIPAPAQAVAAVDHAVRSIARDPWQADQAVVGLVQATGIGDPVAAIVARATETPATIDPARPFGSPLFETAGLGSFYEQVANTACAGGSGVGPTPVDSLVYRVYVRSGDTVFSCRQALDQPVCVELAAAASGCEFTLSYSFQNGLQGTVPVVTPSLKVEPVSSAALPPTTFVVYHRPLDSDFVLTLAATPAPGTTGATTVKLTDFVPRASVDRTLRTIVTTSSSGVVHATTGGFPVTLDGRPVVGLDVKAETRAEGAAGTLDARLARVATSAHAATFDASGPAGATAAWRIVDNEDPRVNNQVVPVRVGFLVEATQPTAPLAWRLADTSERRNWTWEGATSAARVDYKASVQRSPPLTSAFMLATSGGSYATSETIQASSSTQRTLHDGASLDFAHGYGTMACSTATAADYVATRWGATYCSAGKLAGAKEATSVATGGQVAISLGGSSSDLVYLVDVDDLRTFAGAAALSGLAGTARFVATAGASLASVTWTATGPATDVAVGATLAPPSGQQGLSFEADALPATGSLVAQDLSLVLEAAGPVEELSFGTAATTLPAIAGREHVALARQGAALAASASLDGRSQLEVRHAPTRVTLRGSTVDGGGLTVYASDAGQAVLAGTMATTSGAFDASIATERGAVLLAAAGGGADYSSLDLTAKLGTYAIDALVDPTTTLDHLTLELRAYQQDVTLRAGGTLDLVDLGFASSGLGLPKASHDQAVMLTATAAQEYSGRIRLAGLSSADVEPRVTGVRLGADAARAGVLAVSLRDGALSQDVTLGMRPTEVDLTLADAAASVTTTGGSPSLAATRRLGTLTQSWSIDAASAQRLTWATTATGFTVTDTLGSPSGHALELSQAATGSEGASAWRLAGAAGAPAHVVQVDGQSGVVTVTTLGSGSIPLVKFARSTGSAKLPVAPVVHDHVVASLGAAAAPYVSLQLSGVESAAARAATGAAIPAFEIRGSAGGALLVDIRHLADGASQATSTYVSASSRPGVWAVTADFVSDRVSLVIDGDAAASAASVALQRGSRWLRLWTTSALHDVTLSWTSAAGLDITSDGADTWQVQFGEAGQAVPAPDGEDLLAVDLKAGAGGGRITGLERLVLTPTAFRATAGGVSSSLNAKVLLDGASISARATAFSSVALTWTANADLVVEAPTGAGSIAFEHATPTSSTRVGLQGLGAGGSTFETAPGSLEIRAPGGASLAEISILPSGVAQELSVDGADVDATTGRVVARISHATAFTVASATSASPVVATVTPTSAASSGTSFDLRYKDATDTVFASVKRAGTMTLTLPRAQALDAGWLLTVQGATAPFEYRAEHDSGDASAWIEASATGGSGFAIDVLAPTSLEWRPNVASSHDFAFRASTATDSIDWLAKGATSGLSFEAPATRETGTLSGSAAEHRLDWSEGGAGVMAAPAHGQWLRVRALDAPAVSARVLSAATTTWTGSSGGFDVTSDASTSGAALIEVASPQHSARLDAGELGGGDFAIDLRSSLEGPDAGWTYRASPAPKTFQLNYVGVNGYYARVSSDGTQNSGEALARVRPSTTFPAETLRVENIVDFTVESLWAGETLAAQAIGAGASVAFTQGMADLATGNVASSTTLTELRLDYLRTSAPVYRRVSQADGFVVVAGDAPELHAFVQDTGALTWTVAAEGATYTAAHDDTPRSRSAFAAATGDRVFGAERGSATGSTTMTTSLIPPPAPSAAGEGTAGTTSAAAPGWTFTSNVGGGGSGGVRSFASDSDAGVVATSMATGVTGASSIVATTGAPSFTASVPGTGSLEGSLRTAAEHIKVATTARAPGFTIEVGPETCREAGGTSILSLSDVSAGGGLLDVSYGAAGLSARPSSGADIRGSLTADWVTAKCTEAGLHLGARIPLAPFDISTGACEGNEAVIDTYPVPSANNPLGLRETTEFVIPLPCWNTELGLRILHQEVAALLTLQLAPDPMQIEYTFQSAAGLAELRVNELVLTLERGLDFNPVAPDACIVVDGGCLESLGVEVFDADGSTSVTLEGTQTKPNGDMVAGVQLAADRIGTLTFDMVLPALDPTDDTERSYWEPVFQVVTTADLGGAYVTIHRGPDSFTMPTGMDWGHYVVHQVRNNNELMHFAVHDIDALEATIHLGPQGFELDLDLDVEASLPLAVYWQTDACSKLQARASNVPDVDAIIRFEKESDKDPCRQADGMCNRHVQPELNNMRVHADLTLDDPLGRLDIFRSDCQGNDHYRIDALQEGQTQLTLRLNGEGLAGLVDLHVPPQAPQETLISVVIDKRESVPMRVTTTGHPIYIEWDVRDKEYKYVACDTGGAEIEVAWSFHDIAWGFGFDLGGRGGCDHSVIHMIEDRDPSFWSTLNDDHVFGYRIERDGTNCLDFVIHEGRTGVGMAIPVVC